MHNDIVDNPSSLFFAILIHVVLAGLLVLSMDWTPKIEFSAPKMNVINAVVVDQAKLDQIKEAEQLKKQEAERIKRQLEEAEMAQRRQEEETRHQAAEQKKQAEEQRLREIKVAERKKSEAVEQQKQIKIKAEKEAQERKRQEEKRSSEAEAKRKMDEEARRKAEESKRREAELALKEQISAEQKILDAERASKIQSLVSQYTEVIKQKVERNWTRPVDAKKGMSCVVRVRLIPGGQVVQAQVIKSCGDSLVDRSVESAVYKAAPLPLPPDPALFDKFRELTFTFKPE